MSSAELTAPSPSVPSPRQRPAKGPWKLAARVADSNVVVVTALAIFSALVVGALLMIVTTTATLHAWAQLPSHPAAAFSTSWNLVYGAYASLAAGSFESGYALSETLVSAAPLMLAGLAVALAFKAGLFNIGAQGQIIAGAVLADVVAVALPGLPVEIHLPLALLAGFVGGAAAGAVPGLLKARTGAHEVIVTIMFNYVMLNLLIYLLGLNLLRASGQSNAIGKITPVSARLPHLAGDALRLNWGIVVAVVAAGAVAWLLLRSTVGLRFRMVGANPDAARAAGVNISRMVALALCLSGALAGLAGAVQILGVDSQLVPKYGGEIGFTAITVALLGRSSPLGVVLASLLYGALEAGGLAMQAATSVPLDLVSVIQAVIVFFIAAPALVRDIYRIKGTGGGFRAFVGGWSA